MNSPSRQIVAGEVRASMARANITQAELAQRIGISRAALGERLSGQRAFSTDHLSAIADALGVDWVSLMTGPERTAPTAASA